MQKIFQIDAFADTLFSGNPAAVCPLDKWLADDLMQKIAMENNLAETVFYVLKDNVYHIRWFTPTVEVDLCGHATLADAWVIFNEEGYEETIVNFFSERSGRLSVIKSESLLTLDFPVDSLSSIDVDEELMQSLSIKPLRALQGRTDIVLVYENESQIKEVIPDFHRISKMDIRGIIVTAPGDTVDFVSRFFAPQTGVDEDPVTGSAHTSLTPYWSEHFSKNNLTARQLSKRGGNLWCELKGDRVMISGQCIKYMEGFILIDANNN
jgi:PhzF family phenazine biosynthesis protein